MRRRTAALLVVYLLGSTAFAWALWLHHHPILSNVVGAVPAVSYVIWYLARKR